MTIVQENTNEILSIKKLLTLKQTCPICKEKFDVGVSVNDLNQQTSFPFAHVHIHGDPLHLMIIYIDKNHQVRGLEGATSIEIPRDSTIFQKIMGKWANPF